MISLLETSKCEVKLQDRHVESLTANTGSKTSLRRLKKRKANCCKVEIIDHCMDEAAMTAKEAFDVISVLKICQASTKGWQSLCPSKEGSARWETLSKK